MMIPVESVSSEVVKDCFQEGEREGARAGAFLQVKNIDKRFGATQALSQVSLSFKTSEIHCLLGENGAGKSTLGKIIGGLIQPDSGSVLLEGREVSIDSPAKARELGIAIVHQELSLAPDLSVRENMWLGAEKDHSAMGIVNKSREAKKAIEILSLLALDIDVEEPVRKLPVGIQQLVEIAKSLMSAPKLIVFDEPTAMLGAVEKQRFFQTMKKLRDAGITSILITHHVDDVMELGNCVSVMKNGKCVDSFDLEAHLASVDILERLTGKRQLLDAARDRHDMGQEVVLEIEGPGRSGTCTVPIQKGRVVGFYGVVGSGAERIVKGLVGLEQSKGSIRYKLRGKPYTPADPAHASRCGIGYLPAGRQQNGILSKRSIRENLMISQVKRITSWGGVIREKTEKEMARRQLSEAIVKYGDMEDPIESLSGGNQQKILLARTIAGGKELLILEEPTAGVDINAKKQIHDCIVSAAENGAAVIVLSSDLMEAINLCDTIYTLYDGRILNRYDYPDEGCQPQIVCDVLGQHGDGHE